MFYFTKSNNFSENTPRIDPIILTGKGYPDLATRKLLRRLAYKEMTESYYFALVDGDPHGFEIFSTYKYGSIAMAWSAEDLPGEHL